MGTAPRPSGVGCVWVLGRLGVAAGQGLNGKGKCASHGSIILQGCVTLPQLEGEAKRECWLVGASQQGAMPSSQILFWGAGFGKE